MRKLLLVLAIAGAIFWMFKHPEETHNGSKVVCAKLSHFFAYLSDEVKKPSAPEAALPPAAPRAALPAQGPAEQAIAQQTQQALSPVFDPDDPKSPYGYGPESANLPPGMLKSASSRELGMVQAQIAEIENELARIESNDPFGPMSRRDFKDAGKTVMLRSKLRELQAQKLELEANGAH